VKDTPLSGACPSLGRSVARLAAEEVADGVQEAAMIFFLLLLRGRACGRERDRTLDLLAHRVAHLLQPQARTLPPHLDERRGVREPDRHLPGEVQLCLLVPRPAFVPVQGVGCRGWWVGQMV